MLPPATINTAWAQPGGNAAKSMGHPALGAALGQAWTASIGQGGSAKGGLAAAPVVADGTVYTIDSQAVVRAFDAATGARQRSEERRVGKECVSTCRSRGSPYTSKTNSNSSSSKYYQN